MMRFVVFAVSLCTSLVVYGAKIEEGLYGSWKVSAAVDSQDTTSMSSDDVEKLYGKEFVITPALVQFDGEACERPRFKAARKRTQLLFRRDYRFAPKNIDLPDVVTEVKVSCENPVDYFIYIKNKATIVFYWKGFFLRAVKQ